MFNLLTMFNISVTTADTIVTWCAGDTQCGLPGKVDGS